MSEFTLRVVVSGADAGGSMALDKAANSAQNLNNKLAQTNKISQQASGGIGSMGGMLGGLGVPLSIGAAAYTGISFLKESARVYEDNYKAQRLLDSAISSTTFDQKALNDAVAESEHKFVNMGIATSTETKRLATQLVTIGIEAKDVGRVMEQAMRVAAVKGVDAENIIRRLAMSLSNTKDPAEKLSQLMQSLGEYAGGALPQLDALTTGANKFRVQWEELHNKIGKRLDTDEAKSGFAEIIQMYNSYIEQMSKEPPKWWEHLLPTPSGAMLKITDIIKLPTNLWEVL